MDKGQAAMEVSLAGDAPWADAPAGYKRTEVGVIPQEWTLGRLADFGVFRSGSGFPLVYQGLPSGDYPFFKVSDMNNEGNELFMKVANHWIDEKVRKKLGVAKHPIGSIVFAKIGAAIFLERKRLLSQASCIDNNMMAFSLTDHHACQQFFYYLLLKFELGKLVSTTALPSLSGRQIGAIRVPVPPSDEQRDIAEALSDVDGQLSALDALIAKKRSIKRAMMQQLLTGKTRLLGFSGEWETITLGEIADIRNGATPSTQVAAYWNGQIPWCTPSDITDTPGKYLFTTERNVTEEGLASCAASLLPVGALLLCSRATIGEIKIAASPVCTNQGFKSLVCKDEVSNEFLYYLLISLRLKLIERAIGSTFLEIGKRELASLEVKLPPHNEQREIATVLSDIDTEIIALEQQRDKTIAIKQGMMQRLLIGRVRLNK